MSSSSLAKVRTNHPGTSASGQKRPLTGRYINRTIRERRCRLRGPLAGQNVALLSIQRKARLPRLRVLLARMRKPRTRSVGEIPVAPPGERDGYLSHAARAWLAHAREEHAKTG